MYSRPPFWGPKFGPQNGVRPTYFSIFFGVSACVFNALRRGQACWSKRSRVTFFDAAPSEATCAPPSQRAQGRPLSARPDFGPDFGPYFWVLPSDSFSQQRVYKLANVSHTLVSKVETIAVCERERVAHVLYVAQLWPSACPCTLFVVPMRVLFPKKKENRSARFAKAATSSYLVDVSPRTHSFARCVGLVGRLGLGRAHVRMDSSRLYSSSNPPSDPARSPTCVRLSTLKRLPRVASSLRGTAVV